MKIREAIESDREIIKLLKKLEWGTYDGLDDNIVCNSKDTILVAEDETSHEIFAIMGYEMCDSNNPPTDQSHTEPIIFNKYNHLFNGSDKICYLHSAITKKEYRYKGISSYMLDHILNRTRYSVEYYVSDALERGDGSIPSKPMFEKRGFKYIATEIGIWAPYFDGVNTICADCGAGNICRCRTHIYLLDNTANCGGV